MTDVGPLRAVFDTNVVIAALLSRNQRSPLIELLQRWRQREFVLLYCEDLLAEYREKIAAKRVEASKARRLLGEVFQGVRILDGLHFLYVVRGDAPPIP